MEQKLLPGGLHHTFWLLIGLGMLLHAFLSGYEDNWIFWPVSYVLSLWMLTRFTPWFLSFNSTHLFPKALPGLAVCIVIGILHLLLTGVLILLLERLFKVDEHYTLGTIFKYFDEYRSYALEGAGYSALYLLVVVTYRGYLLWENETKILTNKDQLLDQSEWEKLSLQLNPHFLFNAMNSISMIVRKNENSKAVKMIANLNDLLREMLSTDHRVFWTFEEEIRLLSKYLDIEQVRFGDRLTIELTIPGARTGGTYSKVRNTTPGRKCL